MTLQNVPGCKCQLETVFCKQFFFKDKKDILRSLQLTLFLIDKEKLMFLLLIFFEKKTFLCKSKLSFNFPSEKEIKLLLIG